MRRAVSDETLGTFHDSLDRCRNGGRFLDEFYERFVHAPGDIPSFFAGVDISRVKRMVSQSWVLVMTASQGSEQATGRLRRLGAYHRERGVAPRHYDVWLDTLLEVVRLLDAKCNDTVEEAWRTVMGVGIALMRDDPAANDG